MALHTVTGSGSPVGVVTPAYIGQHYVDTGASSVYQAYGTTNTSWVSVVLNGGAAATSASLIDNLELSTSRAAGAETIAIKTAAGTDPSASDKVRIGFRDATAGSGAYSVLELTAATSLTISSGSTLGATSGEAFRLWLVGFNDGGTFRLGIVKCALSDGVRSLSDNGLESSTAEGGAGGADTAGTIYTGTAVTSKAMRVLGYLEYTLTTAGTWDAAPSLIHLAGEKTKLPGDRVQFRRVRDGTFTSGTTTTPLDNTIPQNTEGVEFSSTQAITPTSAINYLQIMASIQAENSANNNMTAALFQDTTANALVAATISNSGASGRKQFVLEHLMRAATTSATTFKVRIGGSGAGTTYFNAAGAAASMGGVMASFISAEEIMV